MIDRIDPERLRQIRSERNRQYIVGLGLLAAGGAVGFSKQNWVVDEGGHRLRDRRPRGGGVHRADDVARSGGQGIGQRLALEW